MPNLSADKETVFAAIKTNAGAYDREWLRFAVKWSVISAFILVVTAFFSSGYYFPDEHWQTIEFAGLKIGKTRPEKMPWEYSAKIRPWLQPAIYAGIAKIADAEGIRDPFTVSMFFRFFSALCAALMCASMVFCSYSLFPEERYRKTAVRTLCLTGFLPYMLVRTSSEALSSAFTMAGFALFMLGSVREAGGSFEYRRYSGAVLFVTGVLWGLAFEFRYQSAFLTAGFVLWMVLVSIKNKTEAVKSVAALFFGIALSVLLGTLIDRWGYGEFVFAPWNYLYQNIFLRKADTFGTLPFWAYFWLMIKTLEFKPSALLTVLLAAGTLCAWIRYPRHPLTWGTILFFTAHCLVPHKELRFLMNMAVPSIILSVCAFSPKNSGLICQAAGPEWDKSNRLGLMPLFYIFNICLLPVYATQLNSACLALDKYIYRNAVLPFSAFSVGGHPYAPWGEDSIQYDWYKPPNITIIQKNSINDIFSETDKKEFNLIVCEDAGKTAAPEKSGFLFTRVTGFEERVLANRINDAARTLLGKKKRNERKTWTLYRVSPNTAKKDAR